MQQMVAFDELAAAYDDKSERPSSPAVVISENLRRQWTEYADRQENPRILKLRNDEFVDLSSSAAPVELSTDHALGASPGPPEGARDEVEAPVTAVRATARSPVPASGTGTPFLATNPVVQHFSPLPEGTHEDRSVSPLGIGTPPPQRLDRSNESPSLGHGGGGNDDLRNGSVQGSKHYDEKITASVTGVEAWKQTAISATKEATPTKGQPRVNDESVKRLADELRNRVDPKLFTLNISRANASDHDSATGSFIVMSLQVREKNHHATWSSVAGTIAIFDIALSHAALLHSNDSVPVSAENFVAGKLCIRWPTLIQTFKKIMEVLRESNKKNHDLASRAKTSMSTQYKAYTNAIPRLVTSDTILDMAAIRQLNSDLENRTDSPDIAGENIVRALAHLGMPLPDEMTVDSEHSAETGATGKALHPMARAIVAHVARQVPDHHGKKTTPGSGQMAKWSEESIHVWRQTEEIIKNITPFDQSSVVKQLLAHDQKASNPTELVATLMELQADNLDEKDDMTRSSEATMSQQKAMETSCGGGRRN